MDRPAEPIHRPAKPIHREACRRRPAAAGEGPLRALLGRIRRAAAGEGLLHALLGRIRRASSTTRAEATPEEAGGGCPRRIRPCHAEDRGPATPCPLHAVHTGALRRRVHTMLREGEGREREGEREWEAVE